MLLLSKADGDTLVGDRLGLREREDWNDAEFLLDDITLTFSGTGF